MWPLEQSGSGGKGKSERRILGRKDAVVFYDLVGM